MPLLVIGRDPIWRARMQRLLATRVGLEWLGAYAPAQPRPSTGHHPAALLLLDGDDPNSERKPRRQFSAPPRRLYFYRQPDAAALLHCIDAHANACLEKLAPTAMVLRAIHAAESGLFVTAPVLLLQALQREGAPLPLIVGNCSNLSRRQLDVLHLAARGLSNKHIARKLEISPETVKTHLQNIFTREGVHNRVELLAMHARADGPGQL